MAFVHGKSTVVLFNGVDISSLFHESEIAAEVDTAETTTFGNSWKTHIAGVSQGTITLAGYFDPTQNVAWATILDDPGGVLIVAPGGVALGGATRQIKLLTSTYAESAPIGGVVAFDWDVMADGAIGYGSVIAASAAITTDGNGAAYDGGAASTAGGVADLHVSSVSASDSIIVTIEDSANGTSGWATIATFASKSAAGAERVLIAGTIKRYVRAVYDVTGSDVSIVCTVALARL